MQYGFQKVLLVTLMLSGSMLASTQASAATRMLKSAPYDSDHRIQANIIQECTTLGEKLSKFTKSFAKKKGMTVELVDSIGSTKKGRSLRVEIVDAVSRGNAFTGHSKYVRIKGSLWENGKLLGRFEGQRSSMGGFASGYKGSCSVLGRCVKALGKDIANWMQDPSVSRRIGE